MWINCVCVILRLRKYHQKTVACWKMKVLYNLNYFQGLKKMEPFRLKNVSSSCHNVQKCIKTNISYSGQAKCQNTVSKHHILMMKEYKRLKTIYHNQCIFYDNWRLEAINFEKKTHQKPKQCIQYLDRYYQQTLRKEYIQNCKKKKTCKISILHAVFIKFHPNYFSQKVKNFSLGS